MRALLIRANTGLVENAIEVSNAQAIGYTPPAGLTLLVTNAGNVGDTLADGVFTAHDPPAPGPITVAASSAKLVLDDDGLYSAVAGICENHPVTAVRIFWESANTWVEDNPYVLAIGVELGLTDAQMHDMFVRAKLK